MVTCRANARATDFALGPQGVRIAFLSAARTRQRSAASLPSTRAGDVTRSPPYPSCAVCRETQVGTRPHPSTLHLAPDGALKTASPNDLQVWWDTQEEQTLRARTNSQSNSCVEDRTLFYYAPHDNDPDEFNVRTMQSEIIQPEVPHPGNTDEAIRLLFDLDHTERDITRMQNPCDTDEAAP